MKFPDRITLGLASILALYAITQTLGVQRSAERVQPQADRRKAGEVQIVWSARATKIKVNGLLILTSGY